MMRSLKIKRARLYLGLTLICLFLVAVHDLTAQPEKIVERIINHIWTLLYVITLNYVLFEYGFAYIGKKRSLILWNILIAVPVVFVFMMLYSWGLLGWRLLGVGLNIVRPVAPLGMHLITELTAFSMFSVFIFGIGRHVYNYIQLRQATQRLRIEKQEAELNYLKSQTNPHFLFNTLNNIYSLSREKSDLAPESILRLSKILRFMLYETGSAYITLEQEVKIISDCIELERLRYDESLRINFLYDVEDEKQAIPPLLLMPLVENAFKHGASETRGSAYVDVHLSVKNRQLVFVVKNSVDISAMKGVIKESIGLSNLRRQLELLYKDFALSVEPLDDVFTAVLKINLGSHVHH